MAGALSDVLTVVILDSFEGDAEMTTKLASDSVHPNEMMYSQDLWP